MHGIRQLLHQRHLLQVEDVEEFDARMEMQLVKQLVVYDRRADHKQVLNHVEFKRTFRLNQAAVYALVEMLCDQLHIASNRDGPCQCYNKSCLHSVTMLAAISSARLAFVAVHPSPLCAVLFSIFLGPFASTKAVHLKMPSEDQMQATTSQIMERFLLPRFTIAVDGMMVRFDGGWRSFLANINLQDFKCRKNFYALNCQVVCNDEFLICDLDCDWPGQTHDARVWAW
jgi:hypothetical protein